MSRRLTIKQRKFISEYVKTGNGTQSALTAYKTTPMTAANIASENLNKPQIVEEIDRILKVNNFSLEENIKSVASIAVQKPETRITADQILKANLELLRLRGADLGRRTQHTSFSLKAELSNMSYSELLASYKKKDKEIQELIDA